MQNVKRKELMANTSVTRVLVVDDSAYVRKVVTQMLSRSPFIDVVGAARDGAEGLELAEQLKPDLITLDLMMPGMNGWETLRKLKADPELFDVPVVVVSIVGSENKGTIFGAADLLNKPVSRDELCTVLRRNVNVKPGKSKVLVVDDDADARQIISEYLADESAELGPKRTVRPMFPRA